MYNWRGNPCVRVNRSLVEEAHPCYYCGVPIRIKTAVICTDCGFAKCPKCGLGFCNAPENVQLALQILRNKYCCNPEGFNRGVDVKGDKNLLDLVLHFKDAVDYCRMAEGKISRINKNPKSTRKPHRQRR